MNKYYAVMYHDEDNVNWILVEDAQPVVVPGWEEYEFFVHRGIYPFTKEYWFVTEPHTGMKMSGGCSTKEYAIDSIIDNCTYWTKDRMDKFILERELITVSPRYR